MEQAPRGKGMHLGHLTDKKQASKEGLIKGWKTCSHIKPLVDWQGGKHQLPLQMFPNEQAKKQQYDLYLLELRKVFSFDAILCYKYCTYSLGLSQQA